MNQALISSIDKDDMFSVLKNFHNQVKEAVKISNKFDYSGIDVKGLKNIIITGLGGSAIGGDLIRSYTYYEIKIPVSINRNYTLPSYANNDTLVIVCSYSGNTEETISALNEAQKKKCRIICLTSGGEIEKIAKKNKKPVFKIPDGLQPRCALGYSFFSLITIFIRLGFISKRESDIEHTIKIIEKGSSVYSILDVEKNPALKLATALKGKLPIVYSSTDTLDIVNLRWRGQFSENSKILAYGNLYPEMNHNELVGWNLNKDILRKTIVLFLMDKSDNKRIKLRMKITKEVIKNYCDNIFLLESDGKSKLERIFDLIYLGDWVSYYLAILSNENPTPVEAIEKLKKQLVKSK